MKQEPARHNREICEATFFDFWDFYETYVTKKEKGNAKKMAQRYVALSTLLGDLWVGDADFIEQKGSLGGKTSLVDTLKTFITIGEGIFWNREHDFADTLAGILLKARSSVSVGLSKIEEDKQIIANLKQDAQRLRDYLMKHEPEVWQELDRKWRISAREEAWRKQQAEIKAELPTASATSIAQALSVLRADAPVASPNIVDTQASVGAVFSAPVQLSSPLPPLAALVIASGDEGSANPVVAAEGALLLPVPTNKN